MNQNSLSPEQIQMLMQYASRRLGMSPEQLARSLQTGGLEGVAKKLSPKDAAALSSLGEVDRTKVEALLQSPEAQQIIRRLLGNS